MPLRITTWNVNGIRNPFGHQPWRDRRTFDAMFNILEADIVIMQELKIQRKDLRDDMVLIDGWDCYFSLPKHKKGYSGVGIYTRKSKCSPIRAEEGLLGVLCPPNSEIPYCQLTDNDCIGGYPSRLQLDEIGVEVDPKSLDAEGRCVVVEFPAFVLFGIYSPANSNGLRDDFRYGFICAMDIRIRNLIRMGKRVVVTGDLNVSREPLDTAGALDDGMSVHDYVSSPNRRIFNQLLEGGKVVEPRDKLRESPVMWDICRGFHEEREGMYTHWEVKINARPANYGSRIDFVLCSLDMKDWMVEADIQAGLMGSDHCPVYAVIKDEIEIEGSSRNLFDVMNPSGMFLDGSRTRELKAGDIPPLSARLMPEFDKRRNIKDMFSQRSVSSTQPPAASSPPSTSSSEPSLTLSACSQSRHESQKSLASSSSPKISVPASLTLKRPPPAMSQSQVSKRIRPGSDDAGKIHRKGQMSMKTFFHTKPYAPDTAATKSTNADTHATAIEAKDMKSILGVKENQLHSASPEKTSIRASPAHELTSDTSTLVDSKGHANETYSKNAPSPQSGTFFDPIASKESWSRLFMKKPPPRCKGHEEPCQSFKTGKKGPNQGREFWLCSRPLGPSGTEEHGTDWRCSTFIWASDWNSNRS